MPVKVGIEMLSAIPGKCGAVGNLWRNNMRLLPEADKDMEFFFFLTPSLKVYYDTYFKDRPGNLEFIEVSVDPENVIKKLLAQEIEVPRLLNRYGIDVHFTSSPAPLFYPVKQIKIYKVTALQFFYVPEQVGLKQTIYHRKAAPRKAKRSDLIIANSIYTKNEIVRLMEIPEEKVCVIYEAVDHDLFNTGRAVDEHRAVLEERFSIRYPYVLFISDLRPYKNPLLLIKGYEVMLKKKDIEEDLLIIGNSILGYGEALKQYVEKSPFFKRIHFLPFQEPYDLLHFYRCASLFVYPSELETFGTPPLEAMACGVPVIVSNKTAVPEVAGEGALTFDPNNIDGLVDVMDRLLFDSGFREKMVKLGYKRAKEFTWKRHAKETVDIIRQLAA
ncbi:glycosyltransferase family 4 protein [bacterium]|nr:glycosyltransferase family 4 protein [bacterium]